MLSEIDFALIFKALSDTNRLQIINTLAGGELCACKLLEKFSITQPTLSYHMKMLCDCGLTNMRKEGKWAYYSLNAETIVQLKAYINSLS